MIAYGATFSHTSCQLCSRVMPIPLTFHASCSHTKHLKSLKLNINLLCKGIKVFEVLKKGEGLESRFECIGDKIPSPPAHLAGGNGGQESVCIEHCG